MKQDHLARATSPELLDGTVSRPMVALSSVLQHTCKVLFSKIPWFLIQCSKLWKKKNQDGLRYLDQSIKDAPPTTRFTCGSALLRFCEVFVAPWGYPLDVFFLQQDSEFPLFGVCRLCLCGLSQFISNARVMTMSRAY